METWKSIWGPCRAYIGEPLTWKFPSSRSRFWAKGFELRKRASSVLGFKLSVQSLICSRQSFLQNAQRTPPPNALAIFKESPAGCIYWAPRIPSYSSPKPEQQVLTLLNYENPKNPNIGCLDRYAGCSSPTCHVSYNLVS